MSTSRKSALCSCQWFIIKCLSDAEHWLIRMMFKTHNTIEYSEFIIQIYNIKCSSISVCMIHKTNPLLTANAALCHSTLSLTSIINCDQIFYRLRNMTCWGGKMKQHLSLFYPPSSHFRFLFQFILDESFHSLVLPVTGVRAGGNEGN